MTDLPATVPFTKIVEAFRVLGIDLDEPGDVKAINLRSGVIEVTRFRYDGEGNHIVTEGGPATITTQIGIEL